MNTRTIAIVVASLLVILVTGFSVYHSQLHALPVVGQSGVITTTECPIGITTVNSNAPNQTDEPVNCGGDVCQDDPAPRDVPPAIQDGQRAAAAESAELDPKVAAEQIATQSYLLNLQLSIEQQLANFYKQNYGSTYDAHQAFLATVADAQLIGNFLKANSDSITRLVYNDTVQAAFNAYKGRAFEKQGKHFGDLWSGTLTNDKTANLSLSSSWDLPLNLQPSVNIAGTYDINTLQIGIGASYACKPLVGNANGNVNGKGTYHVSLHFVLPQVTIGGSKQDIAVDLSYDNTNTAKAQLSWKF